MCKGLITQISVPASSVDEQRLVIGNLALVEITSEDASYPIESALLLPAKGGWRADDAGPQVIRLVFDEPEKLSRISLVFEETRIHRTQEFVLRWSPDSGRCFREIVRQQWTFSPSETVREVEDYDVQLSGVTVLELKIVPDISGGEARASLQSLRLA